MNNMKKEQEEQGLKSDVIAHGAEALLIRKENTVMKQRAAKGYRLPQLDEKLRRKRTKKEARILQKASSLIPVPRVFASSAYDIELEYIEGKKLSDSLDSLPHALEICERMGENAAKLHDSGIIHGDLTTSNMLLSSQGILYFLDFGLAFESARVEDKAVDLHLLKEALNARHFTHAASFFSAVIQGYRTSEHAPLVLKRLAVVEKRGRYKQAY